jgi:hypothetical protein
MAMRPEAQIKTNAAKGQPLKGSLRVQLGTAFNKKPIAAAVTKPKIISWPCQLTGAQSPGVLPSPRKVQSQATSGTAP